MTIYEEIDASVSLLFSENSTPVEYTSRGTVRTLSALRAGVQWNDIETVRTSRLLSSSRDYICRRADFAATLPRPKDTITDGDELWTVYDMADEECWCRLGPSELFIRIHCRK